ncbi:hypothetical protein CC86DRAFT_214484 [Ophiobolus disseminans]|uniref:CBM-cenC domain-containing protein n=1 Tax=Ophiobolus disseminans TaxID=1469910 RepID=A0A6A7A2Z2_9PLEO|nr:hypothetical protein CC86DRAFT_214484 [Ophiobolus disseminans]
MLTTILIWALALLPFLNAMPTTPLSQPALEKRCSNVLQNPSFESGVSPWLEMAFGSWASFGVFTQSAGGHDGRNFYWGQSNATAAVSTLSVSQSAVRIPSGTTVECSVWVASSRPGNVASTAVEVFLDGITCGSAAYLGTTGWVKVGGKITANGDSHTFTVVITSDTTGPQGSQIWIDDAVLGASC